MMKKYVKNCLIILLSLTLVCSMAACGKQEAPAADPFFKSADLGEYGENYTYDHLTEDLRLLEEQYPNRLHIVSIGQSCDGRDLWDAVVGSEDAQNHILIQYSMHAREYMNTILAMNQLQDLLSMEEYNGTNIEELLGKVCIHIVPMSNPDGALISQTSGIDQIQSDQLREILGAAREYDRNRGTDVEDRYWMRWKSNANGVDLNRNYDWGWEEYHEKKAAEGLDTVSADHYPGGYPASEPETQALLSLIEKYPFVGALAYHSRGEVIYYDYGSTGTMQDIDAQLANRIAALTGYAPTKTQNVDKAGFSDYLVMVLGIPAATIETGVNECPLPMEEYASIYEKNKNVVVDTAVFFSEMESYE